MIAWQRRINPKYNSEAAGAPQIMRATLEEQVRAGTVSLDDRFDAATQDRLTVALMRRRGLDSWLRGSMTTDQFGTHLAKEWASLPVLHDTYRGGVFIPRGSAYYGGVGANKSRALVSASQVMSVLSGGPVDASGFEPTGTPGSVLSGKLEAAPDASNSPDGLSPALEPLPINLPGQERVPYSNVWQTASAPRAVLQADNDLALAMAPRADTGYRTVEDGGQGGVIADRWWRAFGDEFTDGFIMRAIGSAWDAKGEEWDAQFDPIARLKADGLEANWRQLGMARNEHHYEVLKENLRREGIRQQRRAAWEGSLAQTLGSISSPDAVLSLAIPGGYAVSLAKRGAAVGRAALKIGAMTAAYETAMEAGRARLDPNSTPLDSFARVGIATLMAGVLGGGATWFISSARAASLARQAEQEMGLSMGVAYRTATARTKAGEEIEVMVMESADPAVRKSNEGAWLTEVNGKPVIAVDESRIATRFAEGDRSGGAKSATELAEYEIGVIAAKYARQQEIIAQWVENRSKRIADVDKETRPGVSIANAKTEGTGRQVVNVVKRGASTRREIDKDAIREAILKSENIEIGGQGKGVASVIVETSKWNNPEAVAAFARKILEAGRRSSSRKAFAEKLPKLMKEHLGYDAAAARAARDDARSAEPPPGGVGGGGGGRGGASGADAAGNPDDIQILHRNGVEHLEMFRQRNNRLFRKGWVEIMGMMVDTAYRRVHRRSLTHHARDIADLLASDGKIGRLSDDAGVTLGPSVYMRSKTWKGLVWKLHDREGELYEKYLGFEKNPMVLGFRVNKETARNTASGEKAMKIEEFRRRASVSYITGEPDDVAEINMLASEYRRYFSRFRKEAMMFGVIDPQPSVQAAIAKLQKRRAWMRKQDKKGAEGGKAQEYAEEIARIEKEMEELQGLLHEFAERPSEDYFTRMWLGDAVRENREAFREQILRPWIEQQPWVQVWREGKEILAERIAAALIASDGVVTDAIKAMRQQLADAPATPEWEWVKLSGKQADMEKRLDDAMEAVLQEAEPADLASMRHSSRPAFGRRRQIDIPNSLLLKENNGIADFIETDGMRVAAMYEARMAPAIEFARTFSGQGGKVPAHRGFDARLAKAEEAEKKAWVKAGRDEEAFAEHWMPIKRDLTHLRDAVTNDITRDPNRWDNRTASALRAWSHLGFMGMSALPATQEIGMLVMHFGLKRTLGAVFGKLDRDLSDLMQKGAREMREAGGNMDLMMSSTLAQMHEVGVDSNMGLKIESWMREAANRYFLFNGLAGVSHVLKNMSGALHVTDLTGLIQKVGMGDLTPETVSKLARYGISMKDAQRMAKMPIERHREGGWLPNTNAWPDEDLALKFRAAVSQMTENTIMVATAADRPTISSGVVLIPKGSSRVDRAATKMGLESDGDYWRMQSGLLTLPFGFWNYAMASTSMVMLGGLDEPTNRKLQGIGALVAMGYIVASIRTPESSWEEMTLDDRLMRAIDQSGVMGVLPQYMGVAGGTALGATGQNPFGSAGYGETRMDGVFDVLGAGPSIARNAALGVTGDLESLRWSLPFSNHFALKGMFDSFFDGLERRFGG